MKHILPLITALLLAFISHAVSAVSVIEFGAKGDGMADDTHAIQSALDTGKNIIIPEGTFRISDALSPKANQVVELIGTVRVAGSNIQRLTADAAAGQPSVTVADASGYYVGQWVTLGAEDLKIQGGGKNKVRREGGDCGRIASIAGNTISFELPLRRAYAVAADARLGTQPSAFLITQPGVRIHGTGVIDGNRAKQFDFAPGDMTPSKGRGEDTRAGCGISIDSPREPIAHLRVEGITIRDCILHNLSLYRAQHSLISHVTCIRAHDKNILLRNSEYCQLIGNQCLDSEFEDGIILYSGNHHCVVQGNICARNARLGICVNAFQTGILLSGNICKDNLGNLSLRGDYCSSTGDFCSGKGGVVIQGRGNQVNGLIALCGVNISATDLSYTGGIISGTPEAPLQLGMEIARTSDDYRVAPVDGVRIRQVTMKHCRTAVSISGIIKDVRLIENRIQSKSEPFKIAAECKEHVMLERNEVAAAPVEKKTK
ncbi:MAG: glycosyl hydrolase family 28-related protein [Verrucomicrobia bacterium]|nr:glycosyl hydrolase family 28-related protein [Verrucomicrobiota bacterium]